MFSKYRKNKELKSERKVAEQFIRIFKSVSEKLNLDNKSEFELSEMIRLMGRSESSADVFIKIVLTIHSFKGIGLNQLKRLESLSQIESFKSIEIKSIKDLLIEAFKEKISETIEENSDEKIITEPLDLYITFGKVITREYVTKTKIVEFERWEELTEDIGTQALRIRLRKLIEFN